MGLTTTYHCCRLIVESNKFRGRGCFCLRFAFCLNGDDVGDLRVHARADGGPRLTWWYMAGDFGPHWHTAAAQLNLTSVSEVGALFVA